MAKDLEKGVDTMIEALTADFNTYNESGKEIPKPTSKFWRKIKKRLSEGLGAEFEKDPASKAADLKAEFLTLGENPRVQMVYAIYLHDKGLSLEE
jgi:hypothetical protein